MPSDIADIAKAYQEMQGTGTFELMTQILRISLSAFGSLRHPSLTKTGDDLKALLDFYIALYRDYISKAPVYVVHLCRGNLVGSRHFPEEAYDAPEGNGWSQKDAPKRIRLRATILSSCHI